MKTNSDRLKNRILHLAELGKTADGINRLSYSDEFYRSNEYIASLMEEAGMQVKTDAVGNVIGQYVGTGNGKIVLHSHIDSVVDAGMFDGCLGVLCAIEAVQTLNENKIKTNHTIEVISFAEEEGLRVGSMVGSKAYCGLPIPDDWEPRLAQYGISMQNIYSCKAEEPVDFAVELHIEQGGVLDSEHTDIGVVTSIFGLKRYVFEIKGQANHAGSTPMRLRDDALIKASKMILRVEELVKETDPHMVGTVGKIENEPNEVNTISGKVVFTLDLRSEKESSIDTVYNRLIKEFKEDIARSDQWVTLKPCPMDIEVQKVIEEACGAVNVSCMYLPSGAGHDTMSMAHIARTGMIFIPSVNGISHSREEFTKWRNTGIGAEVLYETVLNLDSR